MSSDTSDKAIEAVGAAALEAAFGSATVVPPQPVKPTATNKDIAATTSKTLFFIFI